MKRLILAAALAAMATPAMALPPLENVRVVNDGLRDVFVADQIRRNCDGINARMLRAFSFMNNLKGYAKTRGYSDDQIDDFVSSDVQKARMKGLVIAYLDANGVDRAKGSGYCELGKREIDGRSQIGALLWKK